MTGETNKMELVEVMAKRRVRLLQDVFIFGHDLLNEKILNIFDKILAKEDSRDLNAIIISEDGPPNKYGEFLIDAKAMVISLPFILKQTIEAVEKVNPHFGINAAILTNVIATFAHELHHNVSYTTDSEYFIAHEAEEEQLAHDYGMHMSIEVHKCMDAEPPSLGMMPWFGKRIMKHMTRKISEGNETWIHQKEMLDRGLIYHKGPEKFKSLAEFWKVTKPEHNWENEGTELELQAEVTAEHIKNQVQNYLKNQSSDNPTKEELLDGMMQNAMSEGVAPEAFDERVGNDEDAIFDDETGILLTKTIQPVTQAAQPTTHAMSFKEAGKWLWMKLYRHMFTAGEWGDGTFHNPKAIIDQPVQLIENPVACQMVGAAIAPAGKLFTNGTVPCYDVELTINGTKYNMRLLAQNPAKSSQYGQRAAAGERIAWLINQTTEKWVGKIENDTYYAWKDGKWLAA